MRQNHEQKLKYKSQKRCAPLSNSPRLFRTSLRPFPTILQVNRTSPPRTSNLLSLTTSIKFLLPHDTIECTFSPSTIPNSTHAPPFLYDPYFFPYPSTHYFPPNTIERIFSSSRSTTLPPPHYTVLRTKFKTTIRVPVTKDSPWHLIVAKFYPHSKSICRLFHIP